MLQFLGTDHYGGYDIDTPVGDFVSIDRPVVTLRLSLVVEFATVLAHFERQ